MVTNLIKLMSLIKEQEKDFQEKCVLLTIYSKNKTAIEVNSPSHKESLEFNSADFQETLDEISRLEEEIIKNKSILFERNNSLKLPNGKTIQSAINVISIKKTLLKNLEYIKDIKITKERITEVNNSYYIQTEPSFDTFSINNKIEQLKQEIIDTEFEISKLNSIEFEI